MGGIAMLTLSDKESNLHFILILQGLIRHSGKGEETLRKQALMLEKGSKVSCRAATQNETWTQTLSVSREKKKIPLFTARIENLTA